MGTIRVGVAGTGIGAVHIEALQQVPDVAVTMVCSAQAVRAEQTAARLGVPRATTDFRNLLGPEVDAVVVATPQALHAQQALAAVRAGKHVFCEKPLAMSLGEARALRDAARAAGIVHTINHQMRFNAAYARAHELASAGYLGRLAVADARIEMNPVDYLRSPTWSTSKADWFTDASRGGGLLTGSAGPHLVDLLLWYGGPIAAVAARLAVTRPSITLADGKELRDITAEDAFLVLARFAGGGMATIRGLPVAYHRGGFGLDLHGDAGSLTIDGGALRGATAEDRAPAEIALPAGAPADRVAIASAFIGAIREGRPAPNPNFDDGVAVQEVLDAIATAAREERWVKVRT